MLRFDGGAELAGSSSPQVVKLPWSDPSAVDPEELFEASHYRAHDASYTANSVRSDGRCEPQAWGD